MPIYYIGLSADAVVYCEVEIEADSEEEAIQLAYDSTFCSWDIDDVTEITDAVVNGIVEDEE